MYRVVKGNVPSRGDFFEFRDDIWCMLEKCWKFDPTQRPSTQDLSLYFNILSARRLDYTFSRSPDLADGGHQQLLSPRITRRCSTALCLPNPRAILHTISVRSQGISGFLCTPRRRSKSFSEGLVHSLSVDAAPYPCQWKNCQAQFDVLIDCQVHELRHKQALIDKNFAP
jgi:hypothetical protein